MKTLLKIIGFGFIAFIGLAILVGIFSDDTATATAPGKEAIAQPTKTEKAAPAKPDIEIIQQNDTHKEMFGRNQVTIHAKVRNNRNQTASLLSLKTVFYDDNKNIVGTALGNAVDIAAGATKTIDMRTIDVAGATSYEIEVVNVLY